MSDIKNTQYITINQDGIFVGGKPATTYLGEKICKIDFVKWIFAWMQEQNPNITEFHIGAFETRGEQAKPGNPNGVFGPNAWCRVKYKNGNLGAWVFINSYSSADYCAYYCAGGCADYVRRYASFRSAVFGAVDKEKTPQKPINPVVVAVNNEAQIKR